MMTIQGEETTFKRIVWDLETDGLQDTATTIWCVGVQDLDTGVSELFTDYDPRKRSLAVGIEIINRASEWVNHNILGFDIPVLRQLGFECREPSKVYDTLIASQVLYPNIRETVCTPYKVPNKIAWSHSLEAWGYRLGLRKGAYSDWSAYSPEMGRYCLRDVAVNAELDAHLRKEAERIGLDWDGGLASPLRLEHEFKRYIMMQQATGFPFNRARAEALVQPLLEEKENILAALQEVFPPETVSVVYYTEVKKIRKVKEVTTEFNPGSRKQVGERLVAAGWEPHEFTATGLPIINEDTMREAAEGHPQAVLIDRYFTVTKRIGQILEGSNAWLRLEKNGRIHGEVKTLGAVTTRVSHVRPNMSQVPRVGSYLGQESRSLFTAREGWELIGADLSGMELRCLAHYLAPMDKGEYINHVLTGDVHTVHQEAFGLPPGKEYRSIGKSGTFCLIYGGGDWKLGWSLGSRGSVGAVTKAGKKYRASLMHSLPALSRLTDAVKHKRKQGNKSGKHFIRGLIGHPLYCRAEHSAINTLLQAAGATIAKTWYVLFHQTMGTLGYVYGEDYETYIFAHDEIQCAARPEIASVVGEILCQTATSAGELLSTRIPVEAEYKTGFTWADTH